jgi:hypothetical protein
MITIWSLQHPGALALLRSGKPYLISQAAVRRHGEFSEDWKHFRSAYGWMEDQFRLRVGPLPTSRALVWAWYKPKPDFRKGAWRGVPRPVVLLTLRVDPNRVLVSDYEDWHQVLNEAPIAPRELEHDGEAWDRWADEAYAWPKAKKQATWSRIFQPAYMGSYCQAVLAEIRPSDVVAAKLYR